MYDRILSISIIINVRFGSHRVIADQTVPTQPNRIQENSVTTETAKKPSVLFVCVHNAGRSQMAAAFLTSLSKGEIEVRSAGSQPADRINPAAVEAMAEVGIDMSAETPKVLTTEAVKESDVVITMGCGDECPYFPGKRYEDWVLEDPAGKGVESVRPIRDEIKTRIEGLINSLIPAAK
jgi:arsenate reductase